MSGPPWYEIPFCPNGFAFFPAARSGVARSPHPLPVGTRSSSWPGAWTRAAWTDIAHAATSAANVNLETAELRMPFRHRTRIRLGAAARIRQGRQYCLQSSNYAIVMAVDDSHDLNSGQ